MDDCRCAHVLHVGNMTNGERELSMDREDAAMNDAPDDWTTETPEPHAVRRWNFVVDPANGLPSRIVRRSAAGGRVAGDAVPMDEIPSLIRGYPLRQSEPPAAG